MYSVRMCECPKLWHRNHAFNPSQQEIRPIKKNEKKNIRFLRKDHPSLSTFVRSLRMDPSDILLICYTLRKCRFFLNIMPRLYKDFRPCGCCFFNRYIWLKNEINIIPLSRTPLKFAESFFIVAGISMIIININ